MSILDRFSRPLRDLRISVTDRCNLRCTYCMPREVFGADYPFLKRSQILTFEEITRLARIFVRLGCSKIRLTGGEPLLRRQLPELIQALVGLEGLADLTLTTNGLLLGQQAVALKAAGLHRVTVSLDALDDETFGKMNGLETEVKPVLAGIEAAAAAGLKPIKINCVVQRSVNLHAVNQLARYFRGTGHVVRFIEFMDVGNTNGWKLDEVVPAREIVQRIHREFPLRPADPNYTGEVAKRWVYQDGGGEIGVISSVSEPFCGECTRARLSAEGSLYTCLFASAGFDLRELLRAGAPDSKIETELSQLWRHREDRYSELRSAATRSWPRVEMSHIGG